MHGGEGSEILKKARESQLNLSFQTSELQFLRGINSFFNVASEKYDVSCLYLGLVLLKLEYHVHVWYGHHRPTDKVEMK